MAGHHERQIIYRIGQEPPKADVLLHVNVPPTRYKDGKSKGAKNNLKPKQKRRLMVLLAERDGGWFCWYCGNPLTEIVEIDNSVDWRDPQRPTLDHVIAFSRGGSNELHNLRLACHICNNKKGNG